jgi:hypothetical protein
MSEQLFYIAPSDTIFNQMKELALNIWSTYDDTHGYATEKKEIVNSLENVGSNFMTIYQMFDFINQSRIMDKASDDLKKAINERN